MKATLITVVLILASGCGSASTTSSAHESKSLSTTTRTPVVSAYQEWEKAKADLEKLGTGSYEAKISPEGYALIKRSEYASFDLGQQSFALETTTGSTTVDAVLTADGSAFLKMNSWRGPWAGCWLPFNVAAIDSRVQGFTSVKGRSTAVLQAMLSIKAPKDGSSTTNSGFSASIDALSALSLLGLSTREITGGTAGALRSAEVRIDLSVFDEDRVVIDAELHGRAVARALEKAVPALASQKATLAAIADSAVTVHVQSEANPKAITAPPADQILPSDATRNDACPANR